MIKSILIVCTANIIRSPIGALILQKYNPDIKITSAGTDAIEGCLVSEQFINIALKHGYSLHKHTTRRLNNVLLHENNLILAMERKHLNKIVAMFPDIKGKAFLYSHWFNPDEILDTLLYDAQSFKSMCDHLEKAAKEWSERLK